MSSKDRKTTARRHFLTGMGIVATGATLAATARGAEHAPPGQHHGFSPARHPEDSWLDEKPGIHRAFIDSSTALGGSTALNYANNILIGHSEGYGGSDSDYALVVCFRHQSTPFGYNDAIWEKYGEQLSGFMSFTDGRNNDAPFRSNPMNLTRPDFSNRGNTIDSVIARGVSFAICNKATRSISTFLARATGGDAEAIYRELTANNIPDSRFVPAGVLAATRSQEYGYSLLYAG